MDNTPLWYDLHQEEVTQGRRALGEERFEQLAARGAALPLEDFTTMLPHEIGTTLEQILILVRNNTGGLPIQVKQVTFTPT